MGLTHINGMRQLEAFNSDRMAVFVVIFSRSDYSPVGRVLVSKSAGVQIPTWQLTFSPDIPWFGSHV